MSTTARTLFMAMMVMGFMAHANRNTQAQRNADPGLKAMKPAACHMRASLALDACTDSSCVSGAKTRPKAGGRDGNKKGG